MRNVFLPLAFTLSLFILSCSDNSDSSIIQSESFFNKSISNSSNKLILSDFPDFTITKIVNGITGDSIIMDTFWVKPTGDTLFIDARLRILPNSFPGLVEITMNPNPENAQIQFFPEMVFDRALRLDLKYTGLDLASMGYSENTKIDFVYMREDGTVEYVLYNQCFMKWNKQELFVGNAMLPHFSRWGFIRKPVQLLIHKNLVTD